MIKGLETTATQQEGTRSATGGSGEPASAWASTGAVPATSGRQVDGRWVGGAAGTDWPGCSVDPLQSFSWEKTKYS